MTTPSTQPGTPLASADDRAAQQIKSGANWFYWIAGLSVVNSVIALAGGGWYFIIGLGITQVVDAMMLSGYENASDIPATALMIAFFLDVLIAGVFVAFGYLANKEQKWAFVTGMVVYTLDGVLYVLAMDFLSIGFHVFALYSIYKGFTSLQNLERLRAERMMSKYGMTKPLG